MIQWLRRADGTVLVEHRTNGRYTNAAWNDRSTSCLLFDAPDNANTYFWLFRVRGDSVTTEQLDFDAMSREIEATVPRARTLDDQAGRSGLEALQWRSASEIRVELLYNSIGIIVDIDTSKPNEPELHITEKQT